MAVSKKSKFSLSLKMSQAYPNDNANADDDMNSDQGGNLSSNENYDMNSDQGGNSNSNENDDSANSDSNGTLDPSNSNGSANPDSNGDANSNGNNNPDSNGQSNSNSNNNPNPNPDNNSNSNGNQNPSGNSNDQSNSNSNSNPNPSSNSNNNNSSSNSDTNSPAQSGTSNNNNNSPSNSGNEGNNTSNNNNNTSNNNNNNSTLPSPPSQHNNNTSHPPPPPLPSPPPPKGSGRPMFSPPRPALSDGKSSASKSSSAVNAGLLAGCLVGAGMLFMLLIVLVVYCCKKRRKKKEQIVASMKYFPDDQKGAAQQQYYNNNVQNNGPWRASPGPGPGPGHGPGNPHQHQHPHQHQQDMKTGNYSTQHRGPVMPPPPPPNMMTSDMGAGQYSSGPAGPVLPPPPPPSIGFNKSTFTYDELSAATNGFSQSNLIGQGGFGFVHKGLLPTGKEIAVKSLKAGSGQGEREFQAEVEIISRVHHRHLVSLVGYCIAGGQRMLVYEFIPNKTLEYHLHDANANMQCLMLVGHPRIIHRDIKGANILLDDSFEAKVGTCTFPLYLAPEYAASGKLTEKSDVFSFGVMLLELVTGKRPIDNTSDEEESLVDWARPLIPRAIEEGVFEGLADPRLGGKFDAQEMKRLIACAGAATRHSGKRRPKMSLIVRALEGDMSLDALHERPKPGALSGGGSSDYDDIDAGKFRKTGHDSTGYSSSDTESSSSMPKRSPGRGYL
ncbi:hypothetical protein Cgig2_032505 [Carnegiea gigantea]|uniref:non-specific serine/threonine protein kinase n=1 Tax=Carnegiea gigantea TaxID=171969 RepID=A0A9Q1KXI3_9CARY|nr:hypothetical protein Cgig2_032505 [Carnegiea gigantea]